MSEKLMMIIKRTLFVAIMVVALIMCTKKDNPVEPDETKPPGSNLVDTTINNVSGEVKITVPAKVSIVIPAGVIPAGTKLTVQELSIASLPTDKNMDFNSAYEVKLSSGTSFNKDLTISINYNSQKLNSGKLKYKLGAAYYNDDSKKWIAYKDVIIDSVKGTVTFKTNHLTKLSVWNVNRAVYGYTDYLESQNFIVYWKEGTVPNNTAYDSPNKSSYTGTDPHYVRDVLKFLDDGYAKYKSLNLTLPSGRTNVFVTNITEDGETGLITGSITISQNIQFETKQGETQSKSLKKACVHELMHIVQDYYYTTNFTGGINRWWMEATATLSDRIVYPNEPPFESEMYAKDNLRLHRAWDDCGDDPSWYIAGGFLTYLNYYRPGGKVSIVNLIKEGGEIKNGITYRNMLNNHLIYNIHSTIYKEYHDYLLWYLTNSQFGYSSKRTDDQTPFTDYTILSEINDTKESTCTTIPVLAGRIIRVATSSNKDEKLKLIYKSKNSVRAYYYVNTQIGSVQKQTFIKELAGSDSIEVVLSKDQKTWIDIFVINESATQLGGYDVKMKLLQTPSITSISPTQGKAGTDVTINGYNFGTTKGKVFFGTTENTNVTDWNNTFIKVKAPTTLGAHNVSVEVNGAKSNSMQFTVTSDIDFAPLQNCKYISFEAPFYNTMKVQIYINDSLASSSTAEEFQRLSYTGQNTWGQNEITLNGTAFFDSCVTHNSATEKETHSINGSFDGAFSKISSISYKYTYRKTTNDSNYVKKEAEITLTNIPYSGKNTTSTSYTYGSYGNVGKTIIATYTYSSYRIETLLVGDKKVRKTETKGSATTYRASEFNYFSVNFKSTP